MSGRPKSLIAAAAIAGAAGVSLAAIAAHHTTSPALATAATMLMIHATAAVAIASLSSAAKTADRVRLVAWVMLLAVTLFSGDIALNALAGFHLFPMAAPVGGSLLILSWIALAAVAMLEPPAD